MNWSQLSDKERQTLIQEMATAGFTSLDDMEEYYDSLQEDEEDVYTEEETPQPQYSSAPSGAVSTGKQYYIKPDGGIGIRTNEYASGGKIRIKPSKRGTFTAAAKKHGKSVQAFASQVLAHKENYSPAMVKKANFARNAAKWHSNGGNLNLASYAYGGPIIPNNYLPSFIGKREPLPTVRYDEGGDLATLNNPNYNAAKEEAMYNYLINKGLNAAQASGLLGNLAVESYLNADMQQKGGPAYGLMQAEAGRQRAMRRFNDIPYEFGSNLTQEEQQQLDYIIEKGINSYTPGEWGKSGFKGARNARQAFLDTNDVNQASDIITFNYLRPSKPHQDRRRKMSQYYYNKYNVAPLFAPLFIR